MIRRWSRPRRLVQLALLLTLPPLLIVGGALIWVRATAAPYLYPAGTVPARPVALVLGAQVYPDGTPSPFLAARLDVALRLYEAGKVRAVLVSGDDGQQDYNEVDPMRAYLIARGVPATKVVGDYAGFNTYASCVRAARVFGVTAAIVVSQEYHLARAVTLCRGVGIDAVGVGDTSQQVGAMYWRAALRDDLAAAKAAYQLVFRPDPKFLGPHETSVEEALR